MSRGANRVDTVAFGGNGSEPFYPNDDDAWMCEVNVGDGETSFKSCTAIALSCAQTLASIEVPIYNFFTGSRSRVVGINFDVNQFKYAFDDWCLKQVKGMVFLDQYTILISSFFSDTVQKYDIDGTFLGTFAEVDNPTGLLKIVDDTIAVATDDDGVFFFDMNGVSSNKFDDIDISSAHDMTMIGENVLKFPALLVIFCMRTLITTSWKNVTRL